MLKNDNEGKAKDFIKDIQNKLQSQTGKKFVFLLVGRTGVGKSSTVNSLMGKEIAPVGDYEPTTMEVTKYDSEENGIKFTVIDTPGLCDDLEEAGNDYKYLELIRSKVSQVDSMWFVSRLDETRVSTDEKRGIKLISEAFNAKIWENAVIIFTFAGNLDLSRYEFALEKRTELIRKEIAKYAGISIANNIPAVAVDNKSETTPNGEKWIGELYTQVYARMSPQGAIPFLMATVEQIKQPDNEKEIVEKIVYLPTPPEKEIVEKIVYLPTPVEKEIVEKIVYVPAPPEKEIVYLPTAASEKIPTYHRRIELNERQTQIVKNKTSEILEFTAAAVASAGAAIGAIAGPAGAAIGGAIGGVIGFIGGLFKRKRK